MKPRLLAEGCATRLAGPLLFLKRTVGVGLNEAVEVKGGDGRTRLGRVAAADLETLTIEVLESTPGLALDEVVVRFVGEPLNFALGPGILGRVFATCPGAAVISPTVIGFVDIAMPLSWNINN